MPHDVIRRLVRRRAALDAMTAGSTGVAVTSTGLGFASQTSMPGGGALVVAAVAGLVAAGIVWRATRHRRGPAAAARALESAHPASNVVVTFEELQRHPERAPAWVHQLVTARASEHLAVVNVGKVVPSRPAFVLAGLAAVAAVGATLLLTRPAGMRPLLEGLPQVVRDLAPGSVNVRVEVLPPAYAGRPGVTLDNPARIDALAGSTIRFSVAAGVRIRFGDDAVTGPFVARQTGYFAVEDAGVSARLIPITVFPDETPSVRVEDPGKDLLLPAGDRSVAVRFSAADDLALDDLELRYTRVSGRGEQFEFQEGTWPIDVERVSPTRWNGRGQLSLSRLGLEPGDSLVYRVVARDRRAGEAGLGSSDTYFLEILGPGQVALEGVEMPPDMERHALSQQMIVLKLERLQARERTMNRDLFLEESASVAAEQRAVRANFIFLMGGHVEDEEVEAEQSHEIQEGRLENRARRDINAAIGHMTRVEQGLAGASIASALPPARAAVEALQRAFGRSRYLLRSLAVRSRLDPSRRLTGNTQDARSWQRDPPQPADGDEVEARLLFEAILETGASEARGAGAVAAERWKSLAESALRIDPASPFWQETSRSIEELGSRAGTARTEGIRRILERVSVQAQRESLLRSPLSSRDTPVSRAWMTEIRR